MKSTSYRALAVLCLATLVAAGCASDRVTGPEPDRAAAVAGDDLDSTAADGVEKVTICHIPPGNPDNRHDDHRRRAPPSRRHVHPAHGDFRRDVRRRVANRVVRA